MWHIHAVQHIQQNFVVQILLRYHYNNENTLSMGSIRSREFEVFTQIDMNIMRSRNTHNWLISSKSFIHHGLTSFQLWCYTISHFHERAVNAMPVFIVFDLVRARARTVCLWILFCLINCLRQIDFDASLCGALCSRIICRCIYMFSFTLISYAFVASISTSTLMIQFTCGFYHHSKQTHSDRIIDWRMSTITSATMVMAILLFNISLESTTNFSLAHN